MNTTTYFLKLRSNIVLNGDVTLAEREMRAFFNHVLQMEHPEEVQAKIGLPAHYAARHCRAEPPLGFLASDTKLELQKIVLYLNFIQEVWFEKGAHSLEDGWQWCHRVHAGGREFICALPMMACGELLSRTTRPAPKTTDIQALVAFLSGDRTISRNTLKSPTRGGTSTPHVHALHKYKAKFFPRLIRSFLVTALDSLPKNNAGQITLLDPFVGSGTALVEAALLGLDAVGVDIDKLSCAIAQAKLEALTVEPEDVIKAVNEAGKAAAEGVIVKPRYTFPRQIAKKFERWGTRAEQRHYEFTITKWQQSLARVTQPAARHLLEICFSDALTRKFVIRMLGTGVGRFALEIGKTALDTIIIANFRTLIQRIGVAQSVIAGYGLHLGKATVAHGTAVKLPFEDASFSVILTSPPYLPASSGREDYLVGKAISTVALDLMTAAEIAAAETVSVGSMKSGREEADGLPQAVYQLCDWLTQDALRAIKAQPILAYYVALQRALAENFRVLRPRGLAIYVIGKESLFYRFRTREVLYKVACDRIFAELATAGGFRIEEQIDVELDKKNKNARPRSLDSYFESVFLLRKPSENYPRNLKTPDALAGENIRIREGIVAFADDLWKSKARFDPEVS